ncbi:50S ribosomal protein L4 [Methylococcus sp. EFPC2]|uniref:50S ribosomal protein L4 n=1 Tax=Methylococcus sp. EFPC2 TaxID=2812648 RepID=UPI0019681FD5|nr:50S ribosomal protein L4 [Methylococcus sp. EFPC2]QSA95963.1 50S ribosomal protein L4 [Methylococcus sp. EFPC2]
MSLQIPLIKNGKSGEALEVSELVFGQDFNESLVHQLVVSYLAAARSGTKGQKTRADVSGGGAKPWKQKGSGRARAGTTRSPLWRTGGVTFAARNRSYKQKLNKKMYRAALRSIFSELLRQDRLIVTDDIYPSAPKTKELNSTLKNLGLSNALIITDAVNVDLYLAARNLQAVEVSTTSALSPVSLVHSDKVILTAQAVKNLEENLG